MDYNFENLKKLKAELCKDAALYYRYDLGKLCDGIKKEENHHVYRDLVLRCLKEIRLYGVERAHLPLTPLCDLR